MAIGNYAGRARVSVSQPSAQGECDRCGIWFQLDRLNKQMQWAGTQLIWTGYLVCDECDDIPFEQNKTIILPTDPVPRVNPRPGYGVTAPAFAGLPTPASTDWQGFTMYQLHGAITPNYPTTKAAVLSQVATLSGVATPGTISDQSISITKGVAQTLLIANPTRAWMVLYNPAALPCEFALGSTAWNGQLNLSIGPGQAYFWAAAQNLSPIYQGVISAIGEFNNLPLWAWDSSLAVGVFANDNGVMYAPIQPAGYQIGGSGLPPGSVYLVPNILPGNQYAVGVVPGVIPNPAAPPLFLATTSPAALLLLGGGNLSLSDPHNNTQLWNNGGLICISSTVFPSEFVLDVSLLGVGVLG